MDLKDFGKQLDGLSSNNSFDNAIFLPNDVANILPKCVYWNKEVEALWVQNPQEEDNVKRFCTSFFVAIKTNEKGLFINGNLAVKWDNKRIVKENAVMYQSHGAALALMETGIICKFGDDEIDSMIMFNVDENVKKFVEENQSKYISLNLCNFSYWKKEEICVVQKTKNRTTKYKGKIMADETGLYLDGELRYSWDDYFPLVRKKNEKEQLSLLKKTELDNWGDSKYGFYPQKNYFVMSDNAIIDKEDTILVGFAAKIGTDYNSLAEKKDLPVLKENYQSLYRSGNIILTQVTTIDHLGLSTKTFKLLIEFRWIIDTSTFSLTFADYLAEIKNEKVVRAATNMRFLKGTFTIILDKQISYTLNLLTSDDEKMDVYFYEINKSIIRKMSYAKRIDIKLKGEGCDYSVKANELINLAKTFDKELFDSPKHEMDYYKADFLFEKNQYVDANRYILAAVKEVADNAQYNELAEKIKTKLLSIEAESYNKAQTLYAEKKYEDSVKQLDSIYVVSKKEEIDSLRKKVVDDWVVDLTNKGDANIAKKNTVFAINNYKQALKLHPNDDELRRKLKKAEKALGNKMKDIGKLILIVFASLFVILWGKNKYEDYKEQKEYEAYINEIEKEKAQKESQEKQVINAISARLNELCKDISNNNDTRKYLSVRVKGFVDRAWEIVAEKELYGEYLEVDMWTRSQDYETVTAEIMDYIVMDETTIYADVLFKDSHFGDMIKQKINFKFENENWFVDDLTPPEGRTTLVTYTLGFLSRYDDNR